MCAVIGYDPLVDSSARVRRDAFAKLLMESRVRGMHSFGFAQPGRCVKSLELAGILEATEMFDPWKPMIAHCRYSTSGDWRDERNNQPIVVGSEALVFNGVISMGTKKEFESEFDVKCDTENDGEVFLRRKDRLALVARRGSFAGVWLDGDRLFAARNARRPLWLCRAYGAAWYASTRDILRRAAFPWQTAIEVPPL